MADESSAQSPSSVEVEVLGLEVILDSVPLTLLFISSKEWILSLWEGRTNHIENITIWKKQIGKNDGFVLDVNCVDPTASSSFYAKMQRATIDTVLMHHLLKGMKCGPDRFHITLMEGFYSDYHGVITEGVKDWNMASYFTQAQKENLVNEKHQLITTTFLLTFLIELGRFGNIPKNRSNWGLVNAADASIPYPHLALVDFSIGGFAKHAFFSEEAFNRQWRQSLEYLFDKWQPKCGDFEDLQLHQDRTADLRTSLLRGTVAAEQVHYFPFLQSQQEFTQVLQSACDATALWLHEVVRQARVNKYTDVDDYNSKWPSSCDYSDFYTIVKPFHNVERPKVSDLEPQYTYLDDDYEFWVEEWDVNVSMLFEWFPFPNSVDVHDGGIGAVIEATATDATNATA